MDRYESQVNGRPIVYTAEGIQFGGVPVPFDRMTDVQIVQGPTPSWQFTFDGRRMQVPYTEGERAFVEPFVQSAIQAKGMDNLMAAFGVPAEQAAPQAQASQFGQDQAPLQPGQGQPLPPGQGQQGGQPAAPGQGQSLQPGSGQSGALAYPQGYPQGNMYGQPQTAGTPQPQSPAYGQPQAAGTPQPQSPTYGQPQEQNNGVSQTTVSMADMNTSDASNSSSPGGSACKVCGTDLPPGTKQCPSCGAKVKKPIYKRPWFIAAAALILIGIVGGIVLGGGDDSDYTSETSTIETTEMTAAETTEPPETTTAAEATAAEQRSNSSAVSPDFKETMDSYEEFMNDYCEFMKKYENSSDTVSMMADYTEFMSKYNDLSQKIEDIDEESLSDADLAYYVEVTGRVNQKLAEISY